MHLCWISSERIWTFGWDRVSTVLRTFSSVVGWIEMVSNFCSWGTRSTQSSQNSACSNNAMWKPMRSSRPSTKRVTIQIFEFLNSNVAEGARFLYQARGDQECWILAGQLDVPRPIQWTIACGACNFPAAANFMTNHHLPCIFWVPIPFNHQLIARSV